MERTDRLRRRPNAVRYYWLVVTDDKIHTGVSYGGLDYARAKGIKALWLSDIVGNRVHKVTHKIDVFMLLWRENYNNPEWDYGEEK